MADMSIGLIIGVERWSMKVGDLVRFKHDSQDGYDPELGVITKVDTEPFEDDGRHFIQVHWLVESRLRWEISTELESAA